MMIFKLIFYTAIFFLGASLGSFTGVLIDRLPYKKSILYPPSHCDNCNHKLSWYENIPILSYLFLRGRCKNCRAKIPLKFWLIEALFGILALICSLIIFNSILKFY